MRVGIKKVKYAVTPKYGNGHGGQRGAVDIDGSNNFVHTCGPDALVEGDFVDVSGVETFQANLKKLVEDFDLQLRDKKVAVLSVQGWNKGAEIKKVKKPTNNNFFFFIFTSLPSINPGIFDKNQSNKKNERREEEKNTCRQSVRG